MRALERQIGKLKDALGGREVPAVFSGILGGARVAEEKELGVQRIWGRKGLFGDKR